MNRFQEVLEEKGIRQVNHAEKKARSFGQTNASENKCWVVQCKCFAGSSQIAKSDAAPFLSTFPNTVKAAGDTLNSLQIVGMVLQNIPLIALGTCSKSC